MGERVFLKDKDNPYYELRRYSTNRDGGKGDDYYLQGRFDTPEQAYLSAFADMNRSDYDHNSEYFYPILDIVEIEPVEKQVFPVSFATVRQIHRQQQMKLVEIER